MKGETLSVMTNEDHNYPAESNSGRISKRAESSSEMLLNKLSEVYANELFMAEHPDKKNCFEVEKEKLCWLLNLRLNEELARDTLLEAIGGNPENESLYRMLQDVHNHMLEIQQKIDEEVTRINKLTKSCMRQYRLDSWNLQWKRSAAKARMKAQQLGKKMGSAVSDFRHRKRKETLTQEADEGKIAGMVELLDWSDNKIADSASTDETMEKVADHYLEGNVQRDDAAESVTRWHILSATKSDFAEKLKDFPKLQLSIPANFPVITAIRLRMIGIIACIGGYNPSDPAIRTGMHLCLLGSEAENVLNQALEQNNTHLEMEQIAQLTDSQLAAVNQVVASRLLGKCTAQNDGKLGKIPFLNGIVGSGLDAITTFGISNAAKSLFLKRQREHDRQEKMEMARIRILMNMALADGTYDYAEKETLQSIVSALGISEENKRELMKETDSPVKREVDLSFFRGDDLCSRSLLESLVEIANADGQISPKEKIYLRTVGAELGFSESELHDNYGI